jgi:DNA mismatch repair protein MSH4
MTHTTVKTVGTHDDMENNLSTFMTEMKESAYLLTNITPGSFVIVDELGRGTSNMDGKAPHLLPVD